jgi:hypothetical protein
MRTMSTTLMDPSSRARRLVALRRAGLGLLVVACLAGFAGEARAAPPWVERHLTLPGGDWAFDVGLGIAHVSPRPRDITGVGINLEMAVGLVDRLELGVRTGLRLGDDASRGVEADRYGRLFDRQYFDGADGVLANPEVRVRGALVRDEVFELALEGRIIVPVEGNDAGALFGVPLMFHIGHRVRLDTGAYVPVVFGNNRPPNAPDYVPTTVDVALPIDVWIQASPRLWLGPMTGVVFRRVGQDNARSDLSLGFGLGYQITHYLDFKTQLLLPYVTDPNPGPEFGVGAGVQIRIE